MYSLRLKISDIGRGFLSILTISMFLFSCESTDPQIVGKWNIKEFNGVPFAQWQTENMAKSGPAIIPTAYALSFHKDGKLVLQIRSPNNDLDAVGEWKIVDGLLDMTVNGQGGGPMRYSLTAKGLELESMPFNYSRLYDINKWRNKPIILNNPCWIKPQLFSKLSD